VALLFFGAAVLAWNVEPSTDATDEQLKRVLAILDSLGKKVDQQSIDVGKITSDIANLDKRADQLAIDTAKVGVAAAAATQSALGTLTAINQRINDIQSATAELNARVPVPSTTHP